MVRATGSGCDEFKDEPDRFVQYVLADKRIRGKIYDKDSFRAAFREVLNSDPSLQYMIDDWDGIGGGDDCIKGVFDTPDIQNIILENTRKKSEELTKRVRRDHPRLGSNRVKLEVQRRLAISIGVQKQQLGTIKNVNIEPAQKSQKVQRDGGYNRTEPRKFTRPEYNLLVSYIDSTPEEVVKRYQESGLSYRSEASIKKKFQRVQRMQKELKRQEERLQAKKNG